MHKELPKTREEAQLIYLVMNEVVSITTSLNKDYQM